VIGVNDAGAACSMLLSAKHETAVTLTMLRTSTEHFDRDQLADINTAMVGEIAPKH
jgi:hypothetical protein